MSQRMQGPRTSQWRGPLHLVSGLLLAAAAAGQTVEAQTSAKLDPTLYPPQQLFRDIQLTVMACGRDNSAQSCDKARSMADPLMDHPLLSGACKDVVWSVLEHSVVVPKNSYDRREALNRDASQLTLRCKKATKPLGNGTQAAKEEAQKQGGLGGFLKGLGIGGNKAN